MVRSVRELPSLRLLDHGSTEKDRSRITGERTLVLHASHVIHLSSDRYGHALYVFTHRPKIWLHPYRHRLPLLPEL